MPHTKKKNAGKLSRSDVLDALKVIVDESDGEKVGPVQIGLVQSVLREEKGIEVHDDTIRNRGFRNNGFDRNHPEVFDYINFGDTRMRGMVIKREEFYELVES